MVNRLLHFLLQDLPPLPLSLEEVPVQHPPSSLLRQSPRLRDLQFNVPQLHRFVYIQFIKLAPAHSQVILRNNPLLHQHEQRELIPRDVAIVAAQVQLLHRLPARELVEDGGRQLVRDSLEHLGAEGGGTGLEGAGGEAGED